MKDSHDILGEKITEGIKKAVKNMIEKYLV
jgi:hypothetical protein